MKAPVAWLRPMKTRDLIRRIKITPVEENNKFILVAKCADFCGAGARARPLTLLSASLTSAAGWLLRLSDALVDTGKVVVVVVVVPVQFVRGMAPGWIG